MSDGSGDITRGQGQRDLAARERALDVRHSFLVQAPAGSGKTGLLIQRYLALLAHVDRPERIVAMTFTRKAAAEMRERVLSALRDAANSAPVGATRQHDDVTRRLALAALAQDKVGDWQLLAQPSRLRMLTIDALAVSLARQAPVATGLGALPQFVDDTSLLYSKGVRAALAAAEPDDPAWREFLTRVDNDADRAVELLASLLAKRDQWLRLPIGAGNSRLRASLEHALRTEVESTLSRARTLIDASFAARLEQALRSAAQHFANSPGMEEYGSALDALAIQNGVPPATANALPAWIVLADFLLTKKGTVRLKVTKSDGFPAADNEPERMAAKAAMLSVLDDARDTPGFAESLNAVRTLPPPVYGDAAWAFVEATLTLLPRVAGFLLLTFAAEGVADFGEATLRAMAALGEADDPGQLLLAMDYKLAHLLVDEFQDTSWTHRELIGKLTAGWEVGDGRTLFAVGDPMQSIYRFREAEVGIFLEAQQKAHVAGIAVECLDLSRNFRSQARIVDWVNTVFPQVMPAVSDPARGEVAYKPVLATGDVAEALAPTVDIAADRAEEAAIVVRRIREANTAGSDRVVVLVRARSHLDQLLPLVRQEGIDYAAVDLETLAQRLATRDLVTLTRALAQPADRLAGLALLRAPWCGLLLPDLLRIAEGADARTIVDAMADAGVVASLSAEGQARVERLRRGLAEADAQRGRTSLSRRARSAWLALGGPACGNGAIDVAGAERFFALLDQHEHAGDVADWDAFTAATGKLFAEAEPSDEPGVQIMTVHKAKGLEFDTVILPGLDRVPHHGDEPALRWKQREHDGGPMLLLAPLRAREGLLSEADPVYRYLKSLDAAEDAAERGRLLYVGCTRAKRRLHLVATLGVTRKKGDEAPQWRSPKASSALAQLWPAVQSTVASPPLRSDASIEAAMDNDYASGGESDREPGEDDEATPTAQPLRRLSLQWVPPNLPTPIPVGHLPDTVATLPAFDWAHATAAAVGTIVHRLLAQIATEGLAAWVAFPQRLAVERARVMAELAGEGVLLEDRADAAARVETAVANTLADPRGRWLFADSHSDAKSEWALAGVDQGSVRHVTLDRTFVADGVRWIVDFKTGRHEGGDAAVFLDRERDRYRDQLERYARIVRGLDGRRGVDSPSAEGSRPADASGPAFAIRPIRLALYHPLVASGWREWEAPG